MTVDKILKEVGFGGRLRAPAIMKQLAQAMVHPGEVANSARILMQNLEALTNGMGRREKKDEPESCSSVDPFVPWRGLTEAIAAFYAGDIREIKKAAETIPHDTAASALLRQ